MQVNGPSTSKDLARPRTKGPAALAKEGLKLVVYEQSHVTIGNQRTVRFVAGVRVGSQLVRTEGAEQAGWARVALQAICLVPVAAFCASTILG